MNNQNMQQKTITMALAGNPNSGKTALFNSLTGARQHVGNWPGVTVEKKEGSLNYDGSIIKVVDLPGTYSLGAYSEDEAVARDYIIRDKPEVVVNIVDSTNLERNLYLTSQLLEMGVNMVIALNMYDEAKAKHIDIDIERLSSLLGVPALPTVAIKGKGLDELLPLVLKTAAQNCSRPLYIDYGKEIENAIAELTAAAKKIPGLTAAYDLRWLAVKLLEGDREIRKKLQRLKDYQIIDKIRTECVKKLEDFLGDELESVLAEKRYEFISTVFNEAVKTPSADGKSSVSDKIDRIVTNRFLGIPIFLLAMWGMFQFTFTLGKPIAGLINALFGWLGENINYLLSSAGAPVLMNSLIVNGIIGGVGSVMVFIPNIFLLFFVISLLEDSGYMARAAYIMDRFMHTLGLHGKSFIPMIVGFGCNVPGVLAARTLDNKRDRLVTILINPLMSCSARLPVYILFTGAFFSANQGLIIFSLYLLGIMLAVFMGMLFKKVIFKNETSHFVMELPPYRVPTMKNTFIHVWDRGSSFVKKAGTIIVAVVILVWVLSSLPMGTAYASRESLIGSLGALIAPIFKPAGFGTWQAAAALLFGVVAKEVIVGTFGVVYGVDKHGLSAAIAKTWTPLSAYSFMVMTLIYIPCVATIGAIKRETNSWGWTAFTVGYSLLLGWVMAVLVFQAGRLLGLG